MAESEFYAHFTPEDNNEPVFRIAAETLAHLVLKVEDVRKDHPNLKMVDFGVTGHRRSYPF